MRKTVLVLSLLLAASTVAKADGEEHAKHHARHHVAVAAAPKACDPYDVKWHVLGSLGTFVVASALMPWALHDLDDSVAREKGCKFY